MFTLIAKRIILNYLIFRFQIFPSWVEHSERERDPRKAKNIKLRDKKTIIASFPGMLLQLEKAIIIARQTSLHCSTFSSLKLRDSFRAQPFLFLAKSFPRLSSRFDHRQSNNTHNEDKN